MVPSRVFAFTTKASRPYSDVSFRKGDVFLFGPETRGLPDEVRQRFEDEQLLRIPMLAESRSMNLSNSVAVVIYEAWRQLGFAGGS
jgi:tRNA (cytidine/uridine-2'-O-)-methyltransferase